MPYRQNGPNKVNNGILLRSDMHQLFDTGLITVTTDYHIEVSRKIKELYNNGREYYRFHGEPLRLLPQRPEQQPEKASIIWHNDKVFQR
jgi:putative restriction endonuclease